MSLYVDGTFGRGGHSAAILARLGAGADLPAWDRASFWTAALGTAVIVENRAGAAGTMGSDQMAKAAPDGYTIAMITVMKVPTTRSSVASVPACS